jgi:antibiotic biosynthesis monooxygenase (ABM) superfamily enzyme
MEGAASAEGAVAGGPATVVLGQRVKAGRGDDFRRWQDDVNAAAAKFPGFLGTQVQPPVDEHNDWTIVYRFDTASHLYDWLNSATRQDLLDRGGVLFESPGSQQVMVGQGDDALVTVVVSHPVSAENETEFVDWQDRMVKAQQKFPGFRGSELFRPVPGVQDEWNAIYRFGTSEELDRWLESDERKELLRQGENFRDFQMRKVDSLFGSWFAPGGDREAAAALPNWKLAFSVLVGLYPTVVLLTLFIGWVWQTDLWKSLLLGNTLSVILLTWIVTPAVSRALRFWLSPAPDAEQPRTDLLGLIACVAFLFLAAVVFWLVTMVVWLLP